MSTTTDTIELHHDAGEAADDAAPDRFVPWARELGTQFAEYRAGHDREGTFVHEAYDIVRESGYLALAVPVELGGHGATIRQTANAQAEMARHCPSTALALSMHLHITLFTAWRYRRSMPGAEGLLRRVVDERLVLVSTGGSDFTRPKGTAVKVDGGYLVSGRKIFASQVPVGDVFSTMFTYEDPDEGRRVLNMGIPVASEGIEVVETWDALGMRGTGSHDVVFTDVFVKDAQVMAKRPWGVIDPPLTVIGAIGMSVIAAAYLGVAEGARDRAVAAVRGTARADDPGVQRTIGLLDNTLRSARWALAGMFDDVGDDPTPGLDTFFTVMHGKRIVGEAAVSACDLALEVVGGAGYSRATGLEHAVRDVRGVRFHPLTPEQTLSYTGRHALGLPCDEL
jgi:acyl-CoA dehydrogenase